MKAAEKIIDIVWFGTCGWLFANLSAALGGAHRLETLCILLFFVGMYAAGVVASFYVLTGAKWAFIYIGAVALLTVASSLAGFIAVFNSSSVSLVGMLFNAFALASAGVLLFSRKQSAV